MAGLFYAAGPASADPLDLTHQPDLTVAKVVLASLDRELAVPPMPNMSPRLSGAVDLPVSSTDKGPLIQVAGRCGSSEYYCDSPGFLYCCGNSSDGFYCAADVNGCTK
ncbi:excinuclease ABC subunit B [Stappia aggregata IAM 12614]|uniref:Excinuclease ABC subunit B n=2 Tax=Roseibium aggregatum TaxID=187304 RepID=A0NYB4_ROSAI|nr:excinuclease ABC subunit B [Stappia aggregata IAM 12614] [Roseibium aggregatum IAM 12614]